MSVILAHRRVRQEDCKCKVSSGYIAENLSKKKKKQTQNTKPQINLVQEPVCNLSIWEMVRRIRILFLTTKVTPRADSHFKHISKQNKQTKKPNKQTKTK